ncbi:GPI anchored protein [Talaromyces proteolyticus]|uniref:GPI anchored protein n=1 Tax=Talaromyces proteolyticus TaxID=1131652 RepID=A0AAD4L5E2_9EURO|nr:GPI anchored protein [Talaromyces proteolyticus]KAH8703887.1 GPI anchored protein [Talaromyces proteolyticus]
MLFLTVLTVALASVGEAFVHPGLLQSSADFDRIKKNIAAGNQPWVAGYQKLLSSGFATPTYQPNPAPTIYRGSDGVHADNCGQLYVDVGAAYALSLLWAITGEIQWGDAAIRVLDAWSSTLVALGGDTDVFLAAGIYGYQFCQSAEIMRDYSAWTGFSRFQDMMVNVFYPTINDWFVGHENWGSYSSGVYPGWDLSIIAGGMSLGVLMDNETIYNQAVDWFYNGTGNGQINRAIPFVYFYDDEWLAQPMEVGRDQGHTMLDIALLGVIGQTSWNQGLNLFGYNGSLIWAAAEYVARYNLGYDVPYTDYNAWPIELPTISNSSRGNIRPIWELLYNHYGVAQNYNVTWTKKYRDLVVSDGGGAEGGSGDYGTGGGYDQLGWGTLLYTLEAS